MVTITSLNDQKHIVDEDWGKIQWLCNQGMDQGAEMTFGMVYIQPGESNPRHKHPNCEEIIFVLSGSCDHSLDDEMYHLKPGMMLRIPRNVSHQATTTSWEPCRMIIAYSSPDRKTIVE